MLGVVSGMKLGRRVVINAAHGMVVNRGREDASEYQGELVHWLAALEGCPQIPRGG